MEEWRNLYRATLDEVIAEKRPWMRVDHIYRDALHKLLQQRGLAFTQQEGDDLNAAWSRFDAWPDTAEGLTRLRRHFTISTLSNAGMAAVMAIVKRAHLPFDDILTAELVKSYKPAPAVYQFAVDYLGYRPDQILMVACQIRSESGEGIRHAHGIRCAASRAVPTYGPISRQRARSTAVLTALLHLPTRWECSRRISAFMRAALTLAGFYRQMPAMPGRR